MIINVYAYTRSPKIDTLAKIMSLEKKINYCKEVGEDFILDFCGIKKVTLKEDLNDTIAGCKTINVKSGMLNVDEKIK